MKNSKRKSRKLGVLVGFVRTHEFLITSFLLGGVYFYFLTILMDVKYGDFSGFYEEPLSLAFGIDRWFSWSSRLLIESSVNIFSKYTLIWQIITIMAGATMFWCIGRILNFKKGWHAIVVFCLFLFTNFYILATAGVFATTINYLWPVACLVFVLAMLYKPFVNKNARLIATLLSVPILIFAVCSEQVAVVSVIIGFFAIIHMLYDGKKIPKIIWLYVGIAAFGVLNAVVAPGNGVRTEAEILKWWPEFNSLSLIYKGTLGTVVTFSRIFLAPESMAIIFVVLLTALAVLKRNLRAFVSLLPAISLLVLFLMPLPINTNIHMVLPNFFSEVRSIAIHLDSELIMSREARAGFLFAFAIIITGVVSAILFLFGKSKKSYIFLSLIITGLISSLAISFSPTLFASGPRTLYPLVIILLSLNAYLAVYILEYYFINSANTESIEQKA